MEEFSAFYADKNHLIALLLVTAAMSGGLYHQWSQLTGSGKALGRSLLVNVFVFACAGLYLVIAGARITLPPDLMMPARAAVVLATVALLVWLTIHALRETSIAWSYGFWLALSLIFAMTVWLGLSQSDHSGPWQKEETVLLISAFSLFGAINALLGTIAAALTLSAAVCQIWIGQACPDWQAWFTWIEFINPPGWYLSVVVTAFAALLACWDSFSAETPPWSSQGTGSPD